MSLSTKFIPPGSTIGIIGGGQLGRMMALAAKEAGYRICVLDPSHDCPAAQVADHHIKRGYHHQEGLSQLKELCDVITYEFENIDADALDWLEEHAYLPQGANMIRVTQNRIEEKRRIAEAGVPLVPYSVIHSVEEIYGNINGVSYPVVLKTATGGYDGKCQLVIRQWDDIKNSEDLLHFGPCVLENWIDFEKEISVIITRGTDGETTLFPIGENIHKDHILHQTIVPARTSEQVKDKAISYAKRIATELELVGTLAVEMFVTSSGEVFVNELAPRPHNSGHYTIEACVVSQFHQHIRAICGWPLGSTELLSPAIMTNILGEHMEGVLHHIPTSPSWSIHFYGKDQVRKGRKMGHMTLLTEDLAAELKRIDDTGIWTMQKVMEG
ncbi:phosphoribosylaminoimidazole carboxylase [Bacillus coahuilensis m2-6]|uniref:5-(carboxyamino)imidazole ribonucleotide synthase n=1 Tax=Bacillus coahuilensis TaxID=408580 RepID=UPI000750293C|nr:5-(carboxyamino)imidazole ribonucleotide synthase [Bacillus coahuilensis]KUP09945.1 phosphoribosylaminoimidazole carboxylase [Bacillus coahuilensis m2-6]